MGRRQGREGGVIVTLFRHHSIADWATVACDQNTRAVWLLSAHDDPAWWQHEAVRFAPSPAVPGEAPTMASVRAGDRELFICDLTRETRWPLIDAAEDGEVWETIQRIEAALDAPLVWTPATVGLRLAEDTYGYRDDGQGGQLRFRDSAPPADLPHINPCVLHWSRPVQPEEGEWWHFYDLNAAYLAAAQSTPLGAGKPIPASWDGLDSTGRRAGIWQCAVLGDNPVIRMDGWYDIAVVRAALDANPRTVGVGGGWVWPQSPYGLRRWADRLWAARRACQVADDPIGVQAVKNIYTQAFGSFNSAQRGTLRSAYYRPHWYEAIRGESTRRTWRAAQKYDAFLVNVDMVAVASPDAEPIMHHIADRRHMFGGWKPALSLQPSDELRAQAARGALSASQLIKAARKEVSDGRTT